jgi:hypothetical protein
LNQRFALAANRLDKLARFFRNFPDMKPNIPPVLIIFALVCFALVQNTQAVSPPPDGGYPGGNTAEGQDSLLGLTSGTYNTAVGFSSLKRNNGTLNTAIGVNALTSNTGGYSNTATGVNALYSNTMGWQNTANGLYALFSNTGINNTAIGAWALTANTTGSTNTAVGYGALHDNTTGGGNTLIGNGNTALGNFAGAALTTGDNNIDIGNNVLGVAGESNTIRIGNTDITDTFISGISGTTVASGAAVLVDSSGHLGTVTSSKRFKDNIKPMDKASEVLLALKPVTFRYKKEIDPAGISQFGLIAEEVAKVNPALVLTDKEGKPYTVRYEAVNAMLLNEFLKEHEKTEKLEATVASLIATVKEQAAQIQKVSAQLEASKPAPQVVNNP